MKIVVDTLGADAEASVIIKGALEALNEQTKYDLILVGDEESFEKVLSEGIYVSSNEYVMEMDETSEKDDYDYDPALVYALRDRLTFVKATSFVTNNDDPRIVIKERPESSMVKSLQILNNQNDVCAMITAGSTGCALVGSCFHLGLKKGLLQPALASALPTKNGGWVILCDCGSNLEPKLKDFLDYASLAADYAKANYGGAGHAPDSGSIFNLPKVGLVNVGMERGKGTALLKDVYQKLEELSGQNYIFVGNIEGFDILEGNVDVAVCDGFTGNVLIKALEKSGNMAADMVRQGCSCKEDNDKGREEIVERILSTFDYNNRAGAVFLGTKKTIIKAHGSATSDTIRACIMQAIKLNEGGF